MKINDFQNRVYQTAKDKGWWDNWNDNKLPEKLMLIVSEVSEAMEEYRNGHKVDEVYFGEGGKPEGIGVELADAVIRIMDLLGHYGVDLAQVLETKAIYNDTRPYRHGGKLA